MTEGVEFDMRKLAKLAPVAWVLMGGGGSVVAIDQLDLFGTRTKDATIERLREDYDECVVRIEKLLFERGVDITVDHDGGGQ